MKTTIQNICKSLPKRFRNGVVFRCRFLVDLWLIFGGFWPPKSAPKSSQICKKWSWGSSGTRLGLNCPLGSIFNGFGVIFGCIWGDFWFFWGRLGESFWWVLGSSVRVQLWFNTYVQHEKNASTCRKYIDLFITHTRSDVGFVWHNLFICMYSTMTPCLQTTLGFKRLLLNKICLQALTCKQNLFPSEVFFTHPWVIFFWTIFH